MLIHLSCFTCFLYAGEKCYLPSHVEPAFMRVKYLALSLEVIIVGECEIETRKTVINYIWKGLVTSQPPGVTGHGPVVNEDVAAAAVHLIIVRKIPV